VGGCFFRYNKNRELFTGFLILYIFKGRYLLQTRVCSPMLVWNIVYNKNYGFLEVECLSVVLRSIRLFTV